MVIMRFGLLSLTVTLNYQLNRTSWSFNTSTIGYYVILGLASEAGEVAGVLKKVLRDKGGQFDDDTRGKLFDEIGDVLWYCSQACEVAGARLSSIALRNISKLFSRKDRGTIQGSGDNR